MSFEIPFLIAVVMGVSGSFLQAPINQFHTTFNSTFLEENEKLFKPIVIPNITESSEQPITSRIKALETLKTQENEIVLKKILQPKEISEESTPRENYLYEKPKTTKNSLKFSSRYSTKPEILEEEGTDEPAKEESMREEEPEKNALREKEISEKIEIPASEKQKFSERLDNFEDGDEEKEEDTFRYNEPREAEQSEIASTTNEPYPELQRTTSFRSSPYPDDDFENYETTATSTEADSSEEQEEENEGEEGKRSVEDYHNSGSKNYHSIQTPLNQVKYRGPHPYKNNVFESEKIRTRLVSPINRHHIKHNWPYSGSQLKAELEESNEISSGDETHDLDEEVEEEVKTKSKKLGLESAVEKDEFKFDRNKKYNLKEERLRRKQNQKGLAAAEEKDHRSPLLQSLNQYQVEEAGYQPNNKGIPNLKFPTDHNVWVGEPAKTTTENTFRPPIKRKPKQFGTSTEPNFQGHQFLGPVVFNHNLEPQKTRPIAKPQTKSSVLLKGLLTNEHLDQVNLTKQKTSKTVFVTGNEQTFNHLEESDQMYNEILANIQSVFGLRTKPLGGGDPKGSTPQINLDESKSLTWSIPSTKRGKNN